MNATIAVTPEITTLVNVLTVEPENQVKLVESLRANTDNVVSTLPGWISTTPEGGFFVSRTTLRWTFCAAMRASR